jgi:dolichol-phosphate mannosyltransferase
VRTLVVVPTYNEAETIRLTVAGIRQHAPQVDILIADDASPDGTGALADQMAAADSQVQVLHRASKQGLGAAYLAGFEWARAAGYQAVVEMDADGSHRAEDLPQLLLALDHADVVLGSRWMSGGEVVNWPLHRRLLSLGGNRYTRMWLGMPLSDATGGFRAFRMSALQRIDLATVASQGYCFQVDLAWRAHRTGLRIAEVPIVFVERRAGQSKMSGGIVLEAMRMVTMWGLARRARQLTQFISGRKKDGGPAAPS